MVVPQAQVPDRELGREVGVGVRTEVEMEERFQVNRQALPTRPRLPTGVRICHSLAGGGMD